MDNPLFLQGLFFKKLSMKHILSHIEKAISSLQDKTAWYLLPKPSLGKYLYKKISCNRQSTGGNKFNQSN
jgi:hypothetical protein